MFSGLAPRLIAALVGIGIVVALVAFGPAACTSLFSAKQEARTAKGQAEASIDAGAEATNTIGNVMAADAELGRQHEEGLDAIRNAPEGQRGRVTVEQSCRLRLYRDSERCARVRAAGTAEPDPAR